MSEHQKEMAFLRHLILYDESLEGHNLQAKILQIERNERCVRGAVWLMALLSALAAAGLCYAAVFLQDFPQNTSQLILRVFGGLGLGSLICVLTFLCFWITHRRELDARREECRRLITKLMEVRLGEPSATRSSPIVKEQNALLALAASKVLGVSAESTEIKAQSN